MVNTFAAGKNSGTISSAMPRWQRGHATGCRPVDGSSNIRAEKTPLSALSCQLEEVNLPRGSKILFMFSGGIDSPVAMKLLSKFYKVTPIHFSLERVYPKKYVQNFYEILEGVWKKVKIKEMIIVNFSSVLRELSFRVKRKYICVLCRKSMLFACDLLCERHGFKAIATGEVLAQKASQTIYNMQATHFGIKHAVLHPLLCFDKEEIVRFAKKYNLAVERHLGTCRFVPRFPVTQASYERVERIFKEAEIEKLIAQAVEKSRSIKSPEEFREVVKNEN